MQITLMHLIKSQYNHILINASFCIDQHQLIRMYPVLKFNNRSLDVPRLYLTFRMTDARSIQSSKNHHQWKKYYFWICAQQTMSHCVGTTLTSACPLLQ